MTMQLSLVGTMGETILKPVLVVVTFALLAQLASAYLEVDIQKIEQIGEPKYADCSDLKIRKHNKTRKIFGNLTLNIDIGNDIQTEIQILRKTGSGYQLLPYRLPRTSFCDGTNQDPYFYPELVALTNFPKQPIPCPLPKGTYCFYGFFYSARNMPIMIIPSGEYAADQSYWKEGVEIFRMRYYASIINI